MTINCAIIGLGKIGKLRLRAIEALDGAKIVAKFDPYDSTLNNDFQSVEEILALQDVDAVFVATTNNLNAQYARQAMISGKHVFCEKPPAFNAEEMAEVMKVEKETGKVLMYGFNHRQHGAVQEMKSIVDSENFGRILWMRGRYGKSVDEDFFSDWRANKELAGGGILLDQGIHMLDLFLHLGGEFDDVKAYVSNLYWELEGIEDNVFAIMKNQASGLVASLHSTMTQWRHLFSLEVFMESGYMVLNGLRTSSKTYGEEILTIARNRSKAPAATWEDEQRLVFDVDQSIQKEVDLFINAVAQDRRPESGNSHDALAVMVLIDRIYENDLDDRNGVNQRLKNGDLS